MAVPTPALAQRGAVVGAAARARSPYARWFDVDWAAQERAILMPVLGRRIGECSPTARSPSTAAGAEPVLRYFDHVFPVRPGTEDLPLPELLDRQYYRLAHWRVGDEELNYRRFFDIDTLVGVRVEDAQVFAETPRRAARAGRTRARIDGLRIDHPDGLADPRELPAAARHGDRRRLGRGREDPRGGRGAARRLGVRRDDGLRRAAAQVGGLFVDPAGAGRSSQLYDRADRRADDFEDRSSRTAKR